ncbi:glycoside hydrolase [Metschnikowia bicuspidata]|uniref:Glucan 1,3-beta-glucosidase n=1 Tax=Metschnikowia bicuspidata TaxID=27322 RepID=A0A4P9ZIK5_9ASCO|nr:glycoside hydrolase [Metschnikowia bicuspidata]
MKFSVAAIASVLSTALSLALPNKSSQDIENKPVQGVNLGGWFVLEPYITPSLFRLYVDETGATPVDEYRFTRALGEKALEVMKNHWKTWYTEADFQAINQAGLNTVRIPIGYWAFRTFDDDPYVQGQVEYLDKAIKWARKYGLQVWIDLHGAPGSQNGFDNSGLRDEIGYQQLHNIERTHLVLQDIFDKYGCDSYSDVISGIEFLNEPLGPASDMSLVQQFYERAYNDMRNVSTNKAVIHDAFMQLGYWDNIMTPEQEFCNLVLDHHHYLVFTVGELERDIKAHVLVACGWGKDAKKETKNNVCGEFSAALTDCALWLNGVGRGARWSGDYEDSHLRNSCDMYFDPKKWSPDHRINVRRFLEAQLDAFEMTGGWIFWNWKCEDAIDWDMSRLILEGVFPQPLNARKYPGQCD